MNNNCLIKRAARTSTIKLGRIRPAVVCSTVRDRKVKRVDECICFGGSRRSGVMRFAGEKLISIFLRPVFVQKRANYCGIASPVFRSLAHCLPSLHVRMSLGSGVYVIFVWEMGSQFQLMYKQNAIR